MYNLHHSLSGLTYQREAPSGSSQIRSRSSTRPKKVKLTEALALNVFAFEALVRCAGSVALDTCAFIVGCVRASVGVRVSFALHIACLLSFAAHSAL